MATTVERKRRAVPANDDGGVAVEKKPRKPRVTRPMPTVGDTVDVRQLTFKTRGRASKYTEIVSAIQKLKQGRGIEFTPADGESLTELKVRISGLVSRSCKPADGQRYRTRATEDGFVVVYLDKASANGDAE